MKVGIIYSTGFPPQEGIGTYVWELARSLQARGHEIVLITRGDGDVRTQNGVEIHETRFYRCYPFHTHLHRIFVDRAVKRKDLDVLHIHSPLSLPSKSKLPVVSTIHTPITTSTARSSIHSVRDILAQLTARTISPRVEDRLTAASDRVTGVSESVCTIIDDRYGTSSTVLPNAIDPNAYVPGGETKDFFLYVGRLAPRKGLKMLIRAFEILSDRHLSPELRIVGAGPLEEKLQQMVSDRGLQSAIRFEGYVSDAELRERYRNAYCLLLPSRMEGLPTVALEALASATPVVATDVMGNRDIIRDGTNGLLVSSDPGSLAAAIESLQHDPELRADLANNARPSIVPEYTWSTVSSQAEAIYQETVHG